ncbi:TlpA family protein disulfide reductase [Flavobacterium sp. RSB2_4_14]|uniref:TlpA family protein disulfide reductase n=1 Tax=Flavobacterium sp. RSB2_4_14 TaxID=3447665 RepID=UPI003F3DE1AE
MKKLFSFLFMLAFSTVVISQESMTFQADITNKNGDVIYIKQGNTTLQEIKVDSKGVFKATFPVKEGMYQLFDGVEYGRLFLKNGYDLKMTMDASAFDETIKFKGKGAKENNYMAEAALLEEKFNYENLLAAEEEVFKKGVEEKKKADFERLDKAELDPVFVSTYKKELEMNFVGLQQYYTKIAANRKLNSSKAPTFDYENHKGGKTSLESMKGKYVYIDVWATWCGPCRAEIPFLKAAEEKYHGKNIEFVSISVDVDKDHEKWKTFVTDKALGGTQLYADKNWNSDFITAFGINSIPRFILLDPNGIIVDADAKRPSNPKLLEQLDSLLK